MTSKASHSHHISCWIARSTAILFTLNPIGEVGAEDTLYKSELTLSTITTTPPRHPPTIPNPATPATLNPTCKFRIFLASTSQAVTTMSSGFSTPVPSTRKMNVSCKQYTQYVHAS